MNETNTIGNRVKMVRKNLKMNQEQFGQRLGGLKKSSISKIERNENGISERNIQSLCSTFFVNRNWLLTGEEEMFDSLSRKDEVARELSKILSDDPEIQKTQLRFFYYLSKLTEDQWDILATISYSMLCENRMNHHQK